MLRYYKSCYNIDRHAEICNLCDLFAGDASGHFFLQMTMNKYGIEVLVCLHLCEILKEISSH